MKDGNVESNGYVSLGEALDRINFYEQMAAIKGANSDEYSRFDEVKARLMRGECSPEEAIREANAIEGNKQDYH